VGENGKWYPKLYKDLTENQKAEVTEGPYRCLPVHPTQLYSSALAALWCLLLYLFYRRSQRSEPAASPGGLFTKPGCTFALMLILYGATRFGMEFIRDDNPFEFDGLTISQNLAIAMISLGVVLMAVFQKMKLKVVAPVKKAR
jgi:prolipoprotein diacylglyceryltransferase